MTPINWKSILLTLLYYGILSLGTFLAILVMFGCTPSDPPSLAQLTTIQPLPRESVRPFPKHLGGSTLAWTDSQSALWDSTAQTFAAPVSLLLQDGATTLLRYPGTQHADLFDLADTLAPESMRRQQLNPLTDSLLTPVFGLEDFMRLCATHRITPLITLNIQDDTPERIRTIMTTLASHPEWPTPLWELGDTPYARHSLVLDRVLTIDSYLNAIPPLIDEIRRHQPQAHIGIPLDSPLLIRWGMTSQPTWTAQVLRSLPAGISFLTIQHMKWPADTGNTPLDALYLAGIASSTWITQDLAYLRTMMPHDHPLPILVSAYAPLFSLQNQQAERWSSGLAGTILVADWLRAYADSPDIIGATHAALLNGRYLGTIRHDGHERPLATLSRFWHDLEQSDWQALRVNGPAFTAPPHRSPRLAPPGIHSWIRAVGGTTHDTAKLLIINTHPTQWAPVTLQWPTPLSATMTIRTLTGPSLSSGPDDDTPATVTHTQRPWDHGHLSVPPHSLTYLTWASAPSPTED